MRFLLFAFLVGCAHPAPPARPTPQPDAAATAPAPPAPPAPKSASIDPSLEPLRPLLGSWKGDDPDRHSSGGFTLEPALGGKVLERRSWNDGPQGHHEDLMILFASPAGLRAVYFDNEGHSINYAITVSGDQIELMSDAAANQPRFRLRYQTQGTDALTIDFAIAPPGGDQFQHYTGGIVHRVPSL